MKPTDDDIPFLSVREMVQELRDDVAYLKNHTLTKSDFEKWERVLVSNRRFMVATTVSVLGLALAVVNQLI